MFLFFSAGPSYRYFVSPLFCIISFIIFVTVIINVINAFKGSAKYQATEVKRPSNIIDKRDKNNLGNIKYFITFEFEDGKRIELEVDEKTYNSIDIDSYGDLIYKGKEFISFRKY